MKYEAYKYIAFILGAFFLYIAAFTYKDDHQKVQNKLADIWISLSIMQERYGKWKTLILVPDQKFLLFFNRYFDDGRWTFNFIGATGITVILSLLLFAPVVMTKDGLQEVPFLAVISFVLLVGLFYFHRLLKALNLYPVVYISFLLLAFIVETHLAGFQTALSVLLYLMLLLVQGILTFKLTIYLLKDIVPQLIAENGKMKAFLKLLVVLAAVTALWWAVSNLIIDHFLLDIDKSGLFGINNIVRIFYVLFSTAIIIVLPLVILVLFLLFLSLIAINALIWNVLKAPIRSLYEHEVIRKGKLFAILGIAMIALSFPALKNVSIIEKIIGAFF